MCMDEDCKGVTSRRWVILGGAVVATTSRHGAMAQAPASSPPTRVLDDPSITHGRVQFVHNGAATIDGYLARPNAEGRHSAVLVIAGNRISEEYIPNTCAALALAGFVGLAPNVFHPLPDTARTNDEYTKYLDKHTELDRLDDIQMGASYLRSQTFVRPAGMGVMGFCRGGREALLFAARSREIDAVVAFHPAPLQKTEIERLTIPVQIHHGTDDHSVEVENSRRLKQDLDAQKTPVDLFLYEGADHGFLAYTRPFYRPDYAKLAWQRASEFLLRQLK
jgi:carboxymethylenebutenolidase